MILHVHANLHVQPFTRTHKYHTVVKLMAGNKLESDILLFPVFLA